MTDRELLQQALDALKMYVPQYDQDNKIVGNVMQDLRARLAQPEQEPRLAFICKSCECVYADEPVTQCDCLPDKNEFNKAYICTAPQPAAQPVPLTDEQWFKWWQVTTVLDNLEAEIDYPDFLLIARNIEAAHGIKATP